MAAAKTTTRKPTSSNPPTAVEELLLPKWFAEDYISREFDGGRSDFDIIHAARRLGHNVLLYGPTGPGKTSLAMAYASANDLPFGAIPCHGAIEDKAFFGGLIPQANDVSGGTVWGWQDGIVTTIVKNGGVLLLDEVNFLHPRIGAVLHPLLDKRRQITLLNNGGQVINAHKDVVVIAAYNPDYEGTRPLNKAFRNRFAFQLHMDYDSGIEEQLITHNSLLVLATKLRDAQRRGDLETPISTNKLMEFEDIAAELGFHFAVSNFVHGFSLHEQPAVTEIMEMHMNRLQPDFGATDEWEDDAIDDALVNEPIN